MNEEEKNQQGQSQDSQQESSKYSIAEITAVAVSAVVVLFLIGYSIYHAIVVEEEPPYIEVRALTDQIVQRGNEYILPVMVHNTSSPTVEDVRIEATLQAPDGVETRDVSIQNLPEHSHRKVYVAFTQDPAGLPVKASLVSYQIP